MSKFTDALNFAAEQQLFTSQDLTDELGLNRRTASNYCSRLCKQGWIEQAGTIDPPAGCGVRPVLWQ